MSYHPHATYSGARPQLAYWSFTYRLRLWLICHRVVKGGYSRM